MTVDVAEVVAPEPDADGRRRVGQLGGEDVTVGDRRGPDRHVLFPPDELTKPDPGLSLDLEGVVLPGQEVLDGALPLRRVELSAVVRNERLTFLRGQSELDDEAGDDSVGLQPRYFPPEIIKYFD